MLSRTIGSWEVVSSYSSATAPDSHGISRADPLDQPRTVSGSNSQRTSASNIDLRLPLQDILRQNSNLRAPDQHDERGLTIRPATKMDEDGIWEIFHAVVARGDTYAFDPNISREAALDYWLNPETHTFVAEGEQGICGTYILRPNQARRRFARRQRRLHGLAAGATPRDRTRHGRAFSPRSSTPGIPRHAIQLRRLHERTGHRSVAESWVRHRRNIAGSFSASGARFRRRLRHVPVPLTPWPAQTVACACPLKIYLCGRACFRAHTSCDFLRFFPQSARHRRRRLHRFESCPGIAGEISLRAIDRDRRFPLR